MAEFTNKIQESLDLFYNECTDLLHFSCEVPTIPVSALSNCDFYRQYVAKNMPVIIEGCCMNWPAVKLWNCDYFMDKFPTKDVTVAVTPNGYADGVTTKRNENGDDEEYFVLPEEQTMKMSDFISNLKNPKENFVCYIQRQNSNLDDFQELIDEIDVDLEWARQAFGTKPDAINFWMGDARAITSMHKDPYENIYCVIDGHKDFILIPPTYLPSVPYRTYPIGAFKNVTGESFEIQPQFERAAIKTVDWIAVDPLNLDLEAHPQFRTAKIYNVRLKKGDCLYLPGLWFHHVRQSQACIAVNFWYDIDYDVKYCYYKLLEKLCSRV